MRIHPLISDSESLEKLCERLARSDFVAVDTEFMRENTYWPELCLIQVANTEEAAAIRAAILKAAPGAQEIGDRREAISCAIEGLQAGDVLLIAGKGHETGQTIGTTTLPFSDHEAVASALREKIA